MAASIINVPKLLLHYKTKLISNGDLKYKLRSSRRCITAFERTIILLKQVENMLFKLPLQD